MSDKNLKRVRKAFESHPKYRMQQITMVERRKDGGMYQHGPDTVHQSYKGKSLVLRRPKYQVVAMTSKKPNKGSAYVAHVGPNYRVKRGDALRLQQAYKTKTKKVTSGKGVTFNNKVTKSMDDKSLKRAKRASATLSIGGGTLGLGGLTALAMKKPETAAKMSIGATGVGGIGSYNYAAIQRAEAKKRPPRQSVYVVRNKKQIKNIKTGLDPVTKSGGMMDFGLSDVRHGENISKARTLTRNERQKVDNAATAGAVAAPAAGYFGSAGAKAGKAGYKLQRGMGTGRAASHASGARTAVSGVKDAANSGRALTTWLNHPYKTLALVGGGSLAASAGTNKYLQSKPRKAVSKKDWMNISEHERRGRDSRRTAKRGENVAGWGGAAITGAVAHRAGTATGAKYPDMDKQFTGLKSAGKRAKFDYKYGRAAGFDRAASAASGKRELVTAAKKNPHAAVAVGGAALMAGGLATSVAARGNEKRHDRAIAVQRRKRVSKALPRPRNPLSFKPAQRHVSDARLRNSQSQGWRDKALHFSGRNPATSISAGGRTATTPTQALRNADDYQRGSSTSAVQAGNELNRLSRNYKLAGAGAAAATVTAGGGGYALGRRKKVKKDLVFKAYNPEGKRQRRLDNTSTGLSVASGATALGAAKYGRDAVGQKEVTSHKWTTKPVKVKSKTNPTGPTKVVNVSAQGRPKVVQVGTGLRSTNVTGYKAGLKSAGKAGGLGLAAVGLAVGSDRVRGYRRGNGGSYRQLHRGI